MTHTGYAMVDCTGLNLNIGTEQTITGHVLRVSITSADKVTVTNLVAG